MSFFSKQKFFNRYLPMVLSAVLIAGAGFGYLVYKQSQVAEASFSFVNSGQNGDNTGIPSTLQTTVTGVHTGDLVVILVKWEGGDTTISASDGTSSFTDALSGNHAVGTAGAGEPNVTALYLLSSVASGSVTYTVTWGAVKSFLDMIVVVYTPSGGTLSLDGTPNKNVGAGTSLTTGNITTTGTDGIAFAFYGEYGSAISSAQINGLAADATYTGGVANQSEIWTKSYTSGFTGQGTATLGSNNWAAAIMAFKITPSVTSDVLVHGSGSGGGKVNVRGSGSGGGGAATPAFVQVKGDTGNPVFSSSVATGDVVAAMIGWNSVTITLNSVSAGCVSGGLTLVDNPVPDTDNSFRFAMAYGVADSSNTCTITPNFSSAPAIYAVVAHEISGIDTSSPLDGHNLTLNSNNGTGTDAISSGSITTTNNGDYIFGIGMDLNINNVLTTGTGFTGRQTTQTSANGRSETEDQIQSSAGSIAATFTSSSFFLNVAVGVMAFKPGSGGGGGGGSVKFR